MYQKLSAANILLSLIVIAFAFLFPHFGLIPVPFGYSIPVIIIIWLTLKRTNENFASLGFNVKKFELKAVWVGAIAAILLFAFLNYALFPLLNSFFKFSSNLDDFKFVRHHLGNFLFILLMGWVIGGWYEELVFHGYIFTRFEKIFSGKYASAAAFLMTNIIF